MRNELGPLSGNHGLLTFLQRVAFVASRHLNRPNIKSPMETKSNRERERERERERNVMKIRKKGRRSIAMTGGRRVVDPSS